MEDDLNTTWVCKDISYLDYQANSFLDKIDAADLI